MILERTDKIPMNSIKAVVSEPIDGHEDYHLMVLSNILNRTVLIMRHNITNSTVYNKWSSTMFLIMY